MFDVSQVSNNGLGTSLQFDCTGGPRWGAMSVWYSKCHCFWFASILSQTFRTVLLYVYDDRVQLTTDLSYTVMPILRLNMIRDWSGCKQPSFTLYLSPASSLRFNSLIGSPLAFSRLITRSKLHSDIQIGIFSLLGRPLVDSQLNLRVLNIQDPTMDSQFRPRPRENFTWLFFSLVNSIWQKSFLWLS